MTPDYFRGPRPSLTRSERRRLFMAGVEDYYRRTGRPVPDHWKKYGPDALPDIGRNMEEGPDVPVDGLKPGWVCVDIG